MYGGPSSKLGRSAAHNKRLHSSFPPPPRPSGPGGGAGRLSLGGGSARKPAAATAAKAPPAVEETFSLVAGSDALAFSMIIRLAPDLVDEIRRVEAQGGRARMKFDPNPHNPNGNVIDVGGKEFKFTWSREFGDLCDIYEEQQSGEDGNGLFVESGSAWRKLNVQRILDESTKNHLKMRSVEAEQRSKQRKAIVLEPGNPSMSQRKQLAAVEATPWKNYNKKKEAALKKRKVETLPVGGPPKTTHNHKSGFTSTTTSKSKIPSPLPSPPDPFAAASSPLGAVNTSKGNDDAVPSQMMGKQDTNVIPEKEIPTKTNNAMRNSLGGKGNNGSKPTDLQGMLVSLLMDKPTGMSLKALEKAVGNMLPHSVKKIEPIIKKIAKYQFPGKYILKPGVDLESIKKPQNESGSSPDDNNPQMHAREEFHDSTSAPQGGFEEKVSKNEDFEEQFQGKSKVEEELSTLEKVDTHHTSPDIGDEKRGADNSEGQAGSSSESGSESESESESESDSGSESGSRSRSRSRSPAETGSATSTDSDSDASSSSKDVQVVQDGSDEDVDIMSSADEKESRPKPEAFDPRISLPGLVKSPDGRSMQNEFHEKQDGNESDAVEIEKDLPEEEEVEIAPTTGAISNASGKFAGDMKPFSPDLQQLQERQNYIGSLFDERESDVKDSYRHEQSDSSDRLSMGKKKRPSDVKNTDEKSERTKRLKAGNLAQGSFSPDMDVQMLETPHNLSPREFAEGNSKGPTTQLINRADRQGNTTAGLQKGSNQAFPGKPTPDLPHTGQRTFDPTSVAKPTNVLEKPESVRHNKKHPGRDFHVPGAASMQKEKSHRDPQNEIIHATEKKVPRNSTDGSDGSKQLPSMDSHYQKQGKMVGKYKEGRKNALPHLITSPNENNKTCLDKSPVINGRGISLQREHSDLELGELRESTPDEGPAAKQFDRKGSFKHVDKKVSTSEVRNADISKSRSSSKASLDPGKQSPALVSSGFLTNLESTNKKNLDNHFEDTTRSHSRVMPSQSQHLKSDHVEVGSQNKFAESNSKYRNNEFGARQDIDLEGCSESNRRAPVNASKQQDNKRGTVSHPLKENKRRTPNFLEDMSDGGKDLMLVDTNNSDQKKRESSSDENSCSYSKYEKDEPELKGPIRNFTQYKEYVQEYRDKYDSYSSLNKILESYRNEFMKLGKDLENAKGRDMDRYYEILGQMKESYRRCGTRHQRLKKIFIVLHEELEHIKQMIKEFADSYNKESNIQEHS